MPVVAPPPTEILDDLFGSSKKTATGPAVPIPVPPISPTDAVVFRPATGTKTSS